MMSNYVWPISCVLCCFVGLVLGAGLVVYGLHLGFKASYEVRDSKTTDVSGKGLLDRQTFEPGEFDLGTK